MKKSRLRSFGALALAAIVCLALLTGCSGQKLPSGMNEGEVKAAAEKVIALINAGDSAGIRELCTVRVRDALTDDVMSQIFEAIGEGGKFQAVESMSAAGTTDKASNEEFAVVVAKAKYELKTFVYTISFTKQMKLAGLYYR